MLKRAQAQLTRLLASSLPPGEREGLVKALDPTLASAKSAVATLTGELSKAKALHDEAERQRAGLEESLKSARESLSKLEREAQESKAGLAAVQEQLRQRTRDETHPIYGKLLFDFGYKKAYASEPKRLTDKVVLPVWEKQRIFRPERAKQIAKAKTKDRRFGFPGAITVYDLDQPGKRGIVDGQHRIGGLELLLREGDWPEAQLLLTEVYTVGDADANKAVGDLFLEINQAQPAIELDLPGFADDLVKTAIDEVTAILAEDFPEMFKPSSRCRPPHLNVDNFRQELFNSEKAKEVIHGAPTSDPEGATKALLAWVLDRNSRLAARELNDWTSSSLVRIKNPDTLTKALAKCKVNGFYLGLDVSWL